MTIKGLCKNEDWMSVWLGFLILIIFMAGLKFALPQWKWMLDDDFAAKASKAAVVADELRQQADQLKEDPLSRDLQALRRALDRKDRASIREAANRVEETLTTVQDKDIKKKASKLAKDAKGDARASVSGIFSAGNIIRIVLLFVGLWLVSGMGLFLLGTSVADFTRAFPVIFIFTAAAFFVAGNSVISFYGLEVVFWALLFGLLISNTIGVPQWLKSAVRTEFFIKIGLVMMGAEVLFGTMAKVGAYGMLQAVVVIAAVFYVCYWVSKKLGLDDEFASILGAAVSICGVSAAIAAGGAIKGDPKKVSHTISLVLICAVPMLIFQPIIARLMGMTPEVAGAWLGGTIDTTGAVVAAGAIAGEAAMSVAVVVKMAQNVLIGVAAFLLAVWFSFKAKTTGEKPTLREIWTRFPKFVLGFVIASVVFSLLMPEETAKNITSVTKGIRGWLFALAFLCIGLDTNFKSLISMGGGRPAAAFLMAQMFNIFWTLLFAYLIFGGVLLAVPRL